MHAVETTTPLIQGLFDKPIDLLSVINVIPSAIVLLSADKRIMAMNLAAEGLTGYRHEQARGLGCRHILRSNLCQRDCPIDRVRADSRPLCLEGDIINLERERIPVRLTVAPVHDQEGKVYGYIETIEDIRVLRELSHCEAHSFQFGDIIGSCPQMEKLFSILPGIAQTDSSVLITGETGTGKDLVAEAIHKVSNRAKGPFIKVNCGALPENLLESELFGHTKGAFTGAVESKPGRFRLAHNGTLFLTEIGDLPIPLQVKLLTFLDDKIIYPLGSGKGFEADVRVIAATHRNLEAMAREGRFREDLLFRLNVVRVPLPPLRERGNDLRLLLDMFLNKFAERFSSPAKGYSDAVFTLLADYHFPGNIRELKNIVEYAVNICKEELVQPYHLPGYILEASSSLGLTPHYPASQAARPVSDAGQPAPPAAGNGTGQGEAQTQPLPHIPINASWPEAERRMIMQALVQANGKRAKAAEILGWGRSTLWRKMKQHGLSDS